MRPLLHALLLGALAAGCRPEPGHKSPALAAPPKQTLYTSAVSCLDSVDVAAGGRVVRRATGFGPIAVQRVDVWLSKRGDTAPALSTSHCHALTSEHAHHPDDWDNPPAPPIVSELAKMSGADSVVVPVISSKFRCEEKPTWVWGEPAYENDSGRIDCYEEVLTYSAFLYDAGGNLLYKAVHEHELDDEPDTAAQAIALLEDIPLGDPAPLRPDSADPLDTPPPPEGSR